MPCSAHVFCPFYGFSPKLPQKVPFTFRLALLQTFYTWFASFVASVLSDHKTKQWALCNFNSPLVMVRVLFVSLFFGVQLRIDLNGYVQFLFFPFSLNIFHSTTFNSFLFTSFVPFLAIHWNEERSQVFYKFIFCTYNNRICLMKWKCCGVFSATYLFFGFYKRYQLNNSQIFV